jgi:hypothetical protein
MINAIPRPQMIANTNLAIQEIDCWKKNCPKLKAQGKSDRVRVMYHAQATKNNQDTDKGYLLLSGLLRGDVPDVKFDIVLLINPYSPYK